MIAAFWLDGVMRTVLCSGNLSNFLDRQRQVVSAVSQLRDRHTLTPYVGFLSLSAVRAAFKAS
jgi:hypothetical protein